MLKHFRGWSFTLAAMFMLAGSMTYSASVVADEEETKTLTIGSKAPAIDVEHWVSDGHGKFKPVTEFEAGKVYVVEFWATWCGPCISSMPHLAETQAKYAEKGVQIISISDEDLETVEGFLEKPVRAAKGEDPEVGKTYGELTSAYCLTTDPDGSVQTDYMRAAGQNGIPTCFIVGKDAHVEWVGHPMSMDKALAAIVDGSWDRDAFLVTFRKKQERDILMTRISGKMRKGDKEGAMEILADAKKDAEGDTESLKALAQLEFQIRASSAMAKVQAGEIEEGLAELEEIAATAEPAQKSQLQSIRLRLQLQAEKFDDAAKLISDIANDKNTAPEFINQMAWQIHELYVKNDKLPPVIIDAAAAAAQIAVDKQPKNGMILDTLAHLLHHQGKLDEAIEWQTKAVENSGEASDEIKEGIESYLNELTKEKAEK